MRVAGFLFFGGPEEEQSFCIRGCDGAETGTGSSSSECYALRGQSRCFGNRESREFRVIACKDLFVSVKHDCRGWLLLLRLFGAAAFCLARIIHESPMK